MTAASAAPVITDPTDLTPELVAAATEHSEPRARALIADGMDEDAAITQGADDAVLVVRRTAQLASRASALVELVDAYNGSSYRLLRDLGDLLGLSLAYVDRDTVEAHVERTLSETEWAAVAGQFTALDLDEHVGDFGTFRTDWIETVLDKAGVPGYGYTADAQPATGADDAAGGAA